MLQQTQVARVLPAYEAFLDRFPDVVACADAALGEVVRLWDGLGYNRRAVNLHRCAVSVRDQGNGMLPDSLDALLALPGVGPYAAAQVMMTIGRYHRLILDSWTRPTYANRACRAGVNSALRSTVAHQSGCFS